MINIMSVSEIRERLKHRTNKSVAESTGLSLATISEIKNGKQKSPSLKTMEKITKYFQENP